MAAGVTHWVGAADRFSERPPGRKGRRERERVYRGLQMLSLNGTRRWLSGGQGRLGEDGLGSADRYIRGTAIGVVIVADVPKRFAVVKILSQGHINDCGPVIMMIFFLFNNKDSQGNFHCRHENVLQNT